MKQKFFSFLLLAAVFTLAGCSFFREGTAEKSDAAKTAKISGLQKKQAMDKFLNGVAAEARGDFASAILEMQEAAALDPSPGIFYSLAKNYAYLRKYPQALSNIKKAVSEDSANKDFLYLYQEILTDTRQPDSAVTVLSKIISIDSSEVNAYYKLAVLLEKDKPLTAIEIYEKINRIIGSEWNVVIRIVELYERLGMFDKASESVEKLVKLDPSNSGIQKLLIEMKTREKKYDEALALIEELLRYYPDDSEALQKKAAIYIEKNDWKAAAGIFSKMIESPSVPAAVKIGIGADYFSRSLKDSTLLPTAKSLFQKLDKDSTYWEVKMYLGAIASLEGNDSIATEYFTLVTELAPWNADAWIRLGGLYFDGGKYDQAIRVLSVAVEKFPEEFAINLILGISCAQKDEHTTAAKFLSKAVSLNPNDLNALSAYGFTLSRLKDNTKAVEYLKKALKIDPQNVNIMGTLGMIYDADSNWAMCDSIYSAALAVDPDNSIVNNNYAYSLSKRAVELDKALRLAKKAIQLEPKNSSFLDTIGWVYFKMGDYENAKKYIQQSIEVGGEKAVILDHLGDAEYKLGNKDKAMELWKKAFETDPSETSIKEKIEKGGL